MKQAFIILGSIGALSAPLMAQSAELRHYWDFETDFSDHMGGVGGTAGTDVSTTVGHDGNTAAFFPTAISGGGAFDSDGYVELSPPIERLGDGTGPFSFSYWVRLDYDATSNPRGIFDFSSDAPIATMGSDGPQSLYIQTGVNANRLAFRVDGTTGNAVGFVPVSSFEGTADTPTGTWFFIAATFDPASTLDIYLNGDPTPAATVSATGLGTVNWEPLQYIGAFNVRVAANRGTEGGVDDLAIYEGLLTTDQIAALHAGTLAPTDIPAPLRPFPLAIKPNRTNSGNYDFEWESKDGKVYDLVSATALTTPPDTWPVWNGHANLPSGGTSTVLMDISGGGPARFFAVLEKALPPLLAADFESGPGGFVATTDAGTPWEYGTPNSSDDGGVANPGGTVTSGNGDSSKCWGTDIGNPGSYADPTTNACLTSPSIDLNDVTGAELRFAQALDLAPGDSAVVRIIDASTGNSITSGDFPLTITDANTSRADWNDAGPYALPVGAEIRIEWCFSGNGADTDDYIGWYLDDVVVSQVAP